MIVAVKPFGHGPSASPRCFPDRETRPQGTIDPGPRGSREPARRWGAAVAPEDSLRGESAVEKTPRIRDRPTEPLRPRAFARSRAGPRRPLPCLHDPTHAQGPSYRSADQACVFDSPLVAHLGMFHALGFRDTWSEVL